MRRTLASALTTLAGWLTKSAGTDAARPAGTTGIGGFIDSYNRRREPTSRELLRELRNTAYTCATINASVCASFSPRLYVTTSPGQPRPKCRTRPLTPERKAHLERKAALVEEVTEHPLLTLLQQVNPIHNAHDLLELTTLDQEVHGQAFWLLEFDGLDTPSAIWPLPAYLVRPVRAPDSPRLVDYYEYGFGRERFLPEQIIRFSYPDPRDPYLGGLSPLRACFESVALDGEFRAYRSAMWGNTALPSAIVSPKEGISPDERERIEAEWNNRFRRGGQGRVLVAEDGLDVKTLSFSPADLAALAEAGATREDIANAFNVPLSFLSPDTNLANIQASRELHALVGVRPRVRRRDQKLNEQLVRLYDPTGRLFLESDDPLPDRDDYAMKQEKQDIDTGVRSINEVRAERGLPPAPWGDSPWLPLTSAPTDLPMRADIAPRTGRNRDPNYGEGT